MIPGYLRGWEITRGARACTLIYNYWKTSLRPGQEETHIWNERVLIMMYGGGRKGSSGGVELCWSQWQVTVAPIVCTETCHCLWVFGLILFQEAELAVVSWPLTHNGGRKTGHERPWVSYCIWPRTVTFSQRYFPPGMIKYCLNITAFSVEWEVWVGAVMELRHRRKIDPKIIQSGL